MRARQKLTAFGAVALATSAIGGGAVATSHAMSDSTTPVKGTMTVISMTDASDGAIKCVYDDIDLPTLGVGTGVPGQVGSPTAVSGQAISVIGSGPVDANGKPQAGTVTVSSGSAEGPVTEANTTDASTTEKGFETTQIGSVPPGIPPGAIAIDSDSARPGTAEECAALKPTTMPAPPAAP